MRVGGVLHRSIAPAEDGRSVLVVDQTLLPDRFALARLSSLSEAADAIQRMVVRGAPLIGATAAYGMWLAMREDPSDGGLARAAATLAATRPTAVNLRAALDDMESSLRPAAPAARAEAARARVDAVAEEDVATNRAIGRHGLSLIARAWERRGRGERVNVLTHCNAGWLATVDVGTALAPVYLAFDEGLPVHVWVSETRPRSQGARLTAWELREHGVPMTLVSDGAAGHLLQRSLVDLCLVGTDRTTACGDVANKVGTYPKALAAFDNDVPFHVALPSSTVDWSIADGLREVPIEVRDPSEVTRVEGRDARGKPSSVDVGPPGVPAWNPAFDVTPARLVTSLVTERGCCPASREGLLSLFPERRAAGAGARRVTHAALRREIVATARRMNALGINRGTSGNVSARAGAGFLVTPSALPYDETTPTDVVEMRTDGRAAGRREPSTEWRFHAAVYAARPEVLAVVHAHSEAATAVACLRRDVPAFHYMVAVAGGTSIRCAPYATFGSAALADHVQRALDGRRACLLANHGQVAVGASLGAALRLAVEVEALCASYLRALAVAEPVTLSEAEMAEVLANFEAYGRARPAPRRRR